MGKRSTRHIALLGALVAGFSLSTSESEPEGVVAQALGEPMNGFPSCTLNTNVGTSGCDGTVACACATAVPAMCSACAKVDAVNTCGTDPFVRIGYFTWGARASRS